MSQGVDFEREALREPFLEPWICRVDLVGHDADRRAAVDRLEPVEDRPEICSYLAGSRMSSIASTTTASTPGSPTQRGVISLGKSRFG